MLILKTHFFNAADAAFSQKITFYDFFCVFLYKNCKIAILIHDIAEIYLHKHMWCQIKLSDTCYPIIRQKHIFLTL